MQKETKKHPVSSIPYWNHLDEWVRLKVQDLIQSVLEEEVTELLGRTRYSRKDHVDSFPGYRNGYGKPRKLTLSNGTITIRRPRVRNLDERFESRVLPLFERRSKVLNAVIPELYLHGLAEGDFDLALRVALGALIIKERLGLSDEETVEQIRENPYLQYFLGSQEFQEEALFDPSIFVYFRKRFDGKILSEVNERIVRLAQEQETARAKKEASSDNKDKNDPIDFRHY